MAGQLPQLYNPLPQCSRSFTQSVQRRAYCRQVQSSWGRAFRRVLACRGRVPRDLYPWPARFVQAVAGLSAQACSTGTHHCHLNLPRRRRPLTTPADRALQQHPGKWGSSGRGFARGCCGGGGCAPLQNAAGDHLAPPCHHTHPCHHPPRPPPRPAVGTVHRSQVQDQPWSSTYRRVAGCCCSYVCCPRPLPGAAELRVPCQPLPLAGNV